MFPAAHCQPQNDGAGCASSACQTKGHCLYERFPCLKLRRFNRKHFADERGSAVSTLGTIPSSNVTMLSRVCFQPIANGRALRVLGFQFEQPQIMSTPFGGLAELLRV